PWEPPPATPGTLAPPGWPAQRDARRRAGAILQAPYPRSAALAARAFPVAPTVATVPLRCPTAGRLLLPAQSPPGSKSAPRARPGPAHQSIVPRPQLAQSPRRVRPSSPTGAPLAPVLHCANQPPPGAVVLPGPAAPTDCRPMSGPGRIQQQRVVQGPRERPV